MYFQIGQSNIVFYCESYTTDTDGLAIFKGGENESSTCSFVKTFKVWWKPKPW